MSSMATINAFQNRPMFEGHSEVERASADALLKMVSELEYCSQTKRQCRETAARLNQKTSQKDSGVSDLRETLTDDASDVSKTFCEWLTSVRLLQRDPADRKNLIASFAMLVFHSGVDQSGEDAMLSREQLAFVGRAPGWNPNERKIIAVLKSHFQTIKQLSGNNHNGISYTDISNLFSSKKKLRERAALAASDEGAKTGIGIGIIFQIFIMLVSLEFCLNLSLLFAVVGAIVGLCKEQSLRSIVITGLKGAFWGMTAGSAMGAVVAANQASRQFDETLAARVDHLQEDLAQLTFEHV